MIQKWPKWNTLNAVKIERTSFPHKSWSKHTVLTLFDTSMYTARMKGEGEVLLTT